MSFHIGQKVVCVDGNPIPEYNRLPYSQIIYPKVKQIYTIRDKILCVEGMAYWLEEVVNPNMTFVEGYREPGFLHFRFRPLNNVEVIEQLLASAPKPTKVAKRKRLKIRHGVA